MESLPKEYIVDIEAFDRHLSNLKRGRFKVGESNERKELERKELERRVSQGEHGDSFSQCVEHIEFDIKGDENKYKGEQ